MRLEIRQRRNSAVSGFCTREVLAFDLRSHYSYHAVLVAKIKKQGKTCRYRDKHPHPHS